VHGSGWSDAGVVADPSRPGRYDATIAERWVLAMVPQGGIVAVLAARAMAEELGHDEQSLRTFSAVFAGQVAAGPVEIDVSTLRRGRTMSQLTATVRNPGAAAGLTAIAVFGAKRDGYSFTDLTMPEVPPPEECPSFRDDPPPEAEDFIREPLPFWDQIVEGRAALGHAPWEDYEPSTSDRASWQRLDDPPLMADGLLDPLAYLVLCDMMPGAVGEKLGSSQRERRWFGPSADLTVHVFKSAPAGWLLAHNRARWAGDGYASVDLALWDPTDRSLVAYATQVMFFTFPEGW
jgi:acyl-CoA thioesterase